MIICFFINYKWTYRPICSSRLYPKTGGLRPQPKPAWELVRKIRWRNNRDKMDNFGEFNHQEWECGDDVNINHREKWFEEPFLSQQSMRTFSNLSNVQQTKWCLKILNILTCQNWELIASDEEREDGGEKKLPSRRAPRRQSKHSTEDLQKPCCDGHPTKQRSLLWKYSHPKMIQHHVYI